MLVFHTKVCVASVLKFQRNQKGKIFKSKKLQMPK